MKSFLRKIIVLVAVISSVSFATNLTSPTPTYARDMGSCDPAQDYILGLTPWDCDITPNPQSTDELRNNAITIATNVLTDLSVIATYLVLGYIIYGGYLYMFASGDPSKVAAGKKTLAHAFIGFGIAMLSYVIINTIRIALLQGGAFSTCDPTTGAQCQDSVAVNAMITNMLSWAIGIAGVVAVIFVVIGGISYTTSAGDPNKLQKAKQTILYALIGLAIVGLAEIILGVISSIINDAKTTSTTIPNTEIATSISYDNNTLIGKELHEKQIY